MSNVLEYILNLKDGISDKINKISATSEKATSKMQKLEKQTLDNTKAFDKAGKSAEGYGFEREGANRGSAGPGGRADRYGEEAGAGAGGHQKGIGTGRAGAGRRRRA